MAMRLKIFDMFIINASENYKLLHFFNSKICYVEILNDHGTGDSTSFSLG